MSTAYQSNQHRVVDVWWEQTRSRLHLFFKVMTQGGAISDKEVEDALTYLTARLREFEDVTCPMVVAEIHGQLLQALRNMKQSLLYRVEHNDHQAQIRLERALSNIDALRFHLLQFNILV